MPKLRGRAKAAFLARMARGRAHKARGGSVAARLTKSDKRAQAKNVKRRALAIRRRNQATLKRRRSDRQVMPRRKSHRRRASISSGFRRTKQGIGSVFKKGLVGKVVLGIGAGTVAGIALNAIAPQFSGIGKVGAAFLAGGPVGGIAQLVIGGGLGNLGSLFGGSGPTTENSL